IYSMKTKYLLPLTLIAIGFVRVSATIVGPPTFEQLVQQAELIFQGTVTDVRSVWEGEGAQRHIDTYIRFQIDENVKGNATSSYTIRVLGGTVATRQWKSPTARNSKSATARFFLSSTTTSSSF